MPRISPERLERRRQSILDAAAGALLQGEFEAVSTVEIARRANISEGLIYRYFPSKRALLLTVLRRYSDSMIEGLHARVMAEDDFRDRLIVLVEHYLRGLVANPAFTRLYIAEIRGGREGDIEPGRLLTERPHMIWRDMVADGVARGQIAADADNRLTREIIWAAIERAASLHLEGAMSETLSETAKRVAGLLAHGLSRD